MIAPALIAWIITAAPVRVVVGLEGPPPLPPSSAAPRVPRQRIDQLLQHHPAVEVRRLRRAVVLDLPSEDAALALKNDTNVRWVEPELYFPVRLRQVPDDPLYPEQWTLHPVSHPLVEPDQHIYAEGAWAVTLGTIGSEPVRVAVLDDGFDLTHPDLTFAAGFDFSRLDPTTWDDDPSYEGNDWHGTQTAGVVAAQGFNALGVVGVCPACEVVPVRLIGAGGSPDIYTSSSTVAAAIEWAAFEGEAHVINNSWGPPDGNPFLDDLPEVFPFPNGELPMVLQEALLAAVRDGRDGKGCIITWAAGNGNELLTYDGFAANPYVLAVGSTDASGRRAYYSDYGPPLFLMAPSSGQGLPRVLTTDIVGQGGQSPTDTYYGFGGTSASSAMVAGVAALVIAAYPDLTAAQVIESLALSAVTIDPTYGRYTQGRSPFYGYGRVNAEAALSHASVYTDACTLQLEICNDRDDNCDGAIDEGGVCDRCIPTHRSEVCDDHDNNCDGQINEGFVCVDTNRPTCAPCSTSNQCVLGSRCRSTANFPGAWCFESCPESGPCPEGFFCDGQVCVLDTSDPHGPQNCEQYLHCSQDERCDGMDNDCNGLVDDIPEHSPDFIAARAACVHGELGACAERVPECVGGRWRCVDPVTRGPEICDGVDNDCNGVIDDPCSGCVTGARSAPHAQPSLVWVCLTLLYVVHTFKRGSRKRRLPFRWPER